MCKDTIYNNLIQEIPFCFLKINDGECNAINNINSVLSRNLEKSSEKMAIKLISALNFEAPNYYVGIPCKSCDLQAYEICQKFITNKNSSYYSANCLINHNYDLTLEILSKTLTKRNVILVVNEKMSKNVSKLAKFNIYPNNIIVISHKYAFETDYEKVKNKVREFGDNSVVLCMCGSLGRVLAYEWFRYNPSLSCLDLGSFFDPILNGKSYLYHSNTDRFCELCNNDPIARDTEIMKFAEGKLEKECRYFSNPKEAMSYLNNNISKVLKNYENILYNHPTAENYRIDMEQIYNIFFNDNHSPSFLSEFDVKANIIKKESKKNFDNEKLKVYKVMNKSELYIKCVELYNQRNLEDLSLAAELYLNYFGFEEDDKVLKVKFYLGFSLFSSNKNKAQEIFEDLYNNKCCSEDEFFIKCNLDMLYPKNANKVPQIVHLIYFKERELQKYHYQCVKSMLKHLQNYEFRLYNDIEPEDNLYWKLLKQESRIQVIKRERPTEYDGFKIGYVQYAADITRLEVLYEYGGIYMDLDMFIFKNFESIIGNSDFVISEENSEKSNNLINSILISKPKNKYIKLWLESFKTGLRMEKWAYHISVYNKKILEENKHFMLKYNIKILNSACFLKHKWFEQHKFANLEEHISDEMYGLHLFDTILHNTLKDNVFFDKE